MFHRSVLGSHAHKFPADRNEHIPEPGDDWRQMNFDHGPHDPEEAGISPEERQRRLDYLDKEWWPKVLAQSAKEREALEQSPEGTLIKQWQRNVQTPPTQSQGFEVADPEEFQ